MMRLYGCCFVALAFFVASCSGQATAQKISDSSAVRQGKDSTAETASGRAPAETNPDMAVAAPDSCDLFSGKVRRAAKTTVLSLRADTFISVSALRQALVTDEIMHANDTVHHYDTPRTAAERRNVVLKNVYILAIEREDDGDYHLLLASNPSPSAPQDIMTAEVSAIATESSSLAMLMKVRKQYESKFGRREKEGFIFAASDKKTAVRLKMIGGSMFFDDHHYAKHSTIKGISAVSSWEIHPVSVLIFE